MIQNDDLPNDIHTKEDTEEPVTDSKAVLPQTLPKQNTIEQIEVPNIQTSAK